MFDVFNPIAQAIVGGLLIVVLATLGMKTEKWTERFIEITLIVSVFFLFMFGPIQTYWRAMWPQPSIAIPNTSSCDAALSFIKPKGTQCPRGLSVEGYYAWWQKTLNENINVLGDQNWPSNLYAALKLDLYCPSTYQTIQGQPNCSIDVGSFSQALSDYHIAEVKFNATRLILKGLESQLGFQFMALMIVLGTVISSISLKKIGDQIGKQAGWNPNDTESLQWLGVISLDVIFTIVAIFAFPLWQQIIPASVNQEIVSMFWIGFVMGILPTGLSLFTTLLSFGTAVAKAKKVVDSRLILISGIVASIIGLYLTQFQTWFLTDAMLSRLATNPSLNADMLQNAALFGFAVFAGIPALLGPSYSLFTIIAAFLKQMQIEDKTGGPQLKDL